jgi:hypothetical protein
MADLLKDKKKQPERLLLVLRGFYALISLKLIRDRRTKQSRLIWISVETTALNWWWE